MEKEKKKYPIGAEHYLLFEEIGNGVSASVHRALCNTLNEIVAIKILDFERANCDLNNVSREAQTMVLVDHPNVLKSHCSFVIDHTLWVVMPFMAGGSCLHILKAAHPNGFEEAVIATILREVLKGLEYLHQHGHIHRDVKAGNILIDARGGIKLGDFGVSACLFDSGDRQRMRNTFVGTPCWMAPEVMEQLHGYDFKADIWSFGITALELAHGHAPFSKYPPMKVLLMTLQNAPPGLDYESDKKFSKRKEEDMLAQKKIPDGQKEEISQNEYKRGISGWNFNLDDMKAQASLIQDDDVIAEKDVDMQSKQLQHQMSLSKQASQLQHQSSLSKQVSQLQHQSSFSSGYSDAADSDDNVHASLSIVDSKSNTVKDEKADDDLNSLGSTTEQLKSSASHENENLSEKLLSNINRPLSDAAPTSSHMGGKAQNQSQVLSTGGVSSQQTTDNGHSEISSKGLKTSTSVDDLDEKAKCAMVQQKGRFKVTSENVDVEKVVPSPTLQKSYSMQVINQHPASPLPFPSDATPSSPLGHAIFPMLHSVLQTNISQRDCILNLLKQIVVADSTDGGSMPMNTTVTDKSLPSEAAHDREKELLREISDLQWRLICAQEELQKYKAENAQVNFMS
ncbi:uncharacterized protein LOC142556100 isoform X3 [Primulina tabacum]|uniref:uncharacterized protein LOC142556100 isoform X3 n=1 Tax=Primulina tabacum TaxID=48773 RepID=UPI003F59DBF8